MTEPSDILLHVPHSSVSIPKDLGRYFELSEDELSTELIRMTDLFTDVAYQGHGMDRLVFPISRLVVDVERFRTDDDEPMAARGMGAVYTKTHEGHPLKSGFDREALLTEFYDPHHAHLEAWVDTSLERHGRCLILDCHSFPSHPLPCDLDQAPNRPDFCFGTDAFHTPARLLSRGIAEATQIGWSIGIDAPYSGTIVPLSRLEKDPCVASLMLEVRRDHLTDEASGIRGPSFGATCAHLRTLIEALASEFRNGEVQTLD